MLRTLYKIFFTIIVALSILTLTTETHANPENDLLQFTSAGHVLGFRKDSVFIATGSHALRVTFEGASGVMPASYADTAINADGRQKKARPLQKVTYKNLWKDIDLTYDAPSDGIARSTYTVRPHADPERIRLKYNVPIQVLENGSLQFIFKNGILSESAPIAWQIIRGRKIDVAVSFVKPYQHRISFKLNPYDASYALFIDPTLQWNTFMGGGGSWNMGSGIAVDSDGDVFVSGYSSQSWGSPQNGHAGGIIDAFVAKLRGADGARLWNTFMGAGGVEEGSGIAVDSTGNVFVTGSSDAAWGAPQNGYAGGEDAFAAKLSGADGALQWSTFMGSGGDDYGSCIAVDSTGNVFVTGSSNAAWGSPQNGYAGGDDAFAAKLSGADGALQWNTFMGSGGDDDYGLGIAVDSTGDVFVTGRSDAAWGSPQNGYAGGGDAFAAKLSGADGALLWNTFMRSDTWDIGADIAVDSTGDVFVTGVSFAFWGTPQTQSECGITNCAFVAVLSNSAPVIIGHNPLSTSPSTPLAINVTDLIIIDLDNRPNDHILTVYDGDNYTRSGTTITPDADFSGYLKVPVHVNDGDKDSAVFNLFVGVRPELIDADSENTLPANDVMIPWHHQFAADERETPYIGDFNGDGKCDIITFMRDGQSGRGEVYVALSDGWQFGANQLWHNQFATDATEKIVIGDFNGDGKDDMATWLEAGTRQVYAALSDGGGMSDAGVWCDYIGADAGDMLFAGDADGDGDDDLILFNRAQARVFVALSTGFSFETPTVWHNWFAASVHERPRVGDVNGDGRDDIITFGTDSHTAKGDVYAALSSGASFGANAKWHDWFGVEPRQILRVGDFNGDGKDDFFTFMPPPSGQIYNVLSLGHAMGPNVSIRDSGVAESETDLPFVGDVNGDGKADIIVFARAEGRVYVALSTGTAVTVSQ